MNYGDIYDENFLDRFGDYQSNISSILLNEGKAQYEIDVVSIAKSCDIPIKYARIIDLSASFLNVPTQQLNSRLNELQILIDGE